ncbi:MAG: hypothetical protein ABL934_04005 [Lysobacteraceae bacterium]
MFQICQNDSCGFRFVVPGFIVMPLYESVRGDALCAVLQRDRTRLTMHVRIAHGTLQRSIIDCKRIQAHDALGSVASSRFRARKAVAHQHAARMQLRRITSAWRRSAWR